MPGRFVLARFLAGAGLTLAASVAHAQTYTTVVDRDNRTVTMSGPSGTVSVRSSTYGGTTTYVTTVTRTGAYQPMGNGRYRPMGRR